MRRTWRLRTQALGLVTVVHRSDLQDGEDGVIVPVQEADIARWLSDPVLSLSVLQMYEDVRGRGVTSGSSLQRLLKRHLVKDLTNAFRRRELIALRRRDVWTPTVVIPVDAAPESPPSVTPPSDKKKTWVEIVLLDDLGEPVPNMPYRLKLPDGSIREGRLDSQGRARADGIDHGTCDVTFQELDGREWRSA